MKLNVTVEGIKSTVGALENLRKGIKDFRGATWMRVRQAFYKVEKEVFSSEGSASASGKWAPLTSPYKELKQKKYGSKPILQASGAMYKEFTSSPAAIDEKAEEMTLSFSKPAGYHKHGTKKMPRRDMTDLTDAQKEQIQEPIKLRLRQLIDNLKLASLKNG